MTLALASISKTPDWASRSSPGFFISTFFLKRHSYTNCVSSALPLALSRLARVNISLRTTNDDIAPTYYLCTIWESVASAKANIG